MRTRIRTDPPIAVRAHARNRVGVALIAAALALSPLTASSADPQVEPAATASEASPQTIEVFASAPSGPAHGDAQRATSNVQSIDDEQLGRPGHRSVSDSLQDLDSVFVTDATGSGFQPDVYYRGYSISPLLGLPQGLSLYQDGVRINEVFGDTVNFDLVPLIAIARADLVPGSNPVFGRNTLGGALTLTTKTGFDAPGAGIQFSLGDYRNGGMGADYAVALSPTVALYVAGEAYEEPGWRQEQHSRAARLFTRGTWLPDADTQIDLSFTGADNRLRGNGAAPIELLDRDGRGAVFTKYDQTRPRLAFVNLWGSRRLPDGITLSAGSYFRRNHTSTYNGDGTEFAPCTDPANVDGGSGDPFLCEPEDGGEEVIEDLAGDPVVAGDANDSATRNRSRTEQSAYGASVQIEANLGAHRLVAGAGADLGDIRFAADTELARLNARRGTVGSGVRVGESVVDVHADNDNVGAYLMDTWRLTHKLELTLAGRFDRTVIELRDQAPDGDLSGRHRFSQFNPMVGGAYTLGSGWTVFASAGRTTRVPTPVELTCANPDDPCRLPNGFVDDPPLKEVRTRTVELGVRHRGPRLTGSMALFDAVSDDDILFITDGESTNTGFFDNVGKTRRRGVELGAQLPLGRGWTTGLQYTALIAEFRHDFLANSPNHPVRDPVDPDQPAAQTRQVRKGDRIPLIPRQQARATLGWSNPAFSFELELIGRGDSRYRGDESNEDPQKLDGFVLANLDASWTPRRGIEVYAGVDNLFDRDVETFGVYGEAEDVLGEDFEDARRFVGPGAPRLFETGVRLRF